MSDPNSLVNMAPRKPTQDQKRTMLQAELAARVTEMAKQLAGSETKPEKEGKTSKGKKNAKAKKGTKLQTDETVEKDIMGQEETTKSGSNTKVEQDAKPSGKTEPAAEVKCKFPLMELEPEVIQNVLRYCFVRPDGIVPGLVRYSLDYSQPGTKISVKQYQWESRRQVSYNETDLPKYDRSGETLQYSWSSPATAADLELVKTGGAKTTSYVRVWRLPDTEDHVTGHTIANFLQERGTCRAKVLHMSNSKTTGIFGVAMLRMNKLLYKLGTPMLYSNLFVFDTRGQTPFTNARGIHDFDALHKRRDLIPGLPYPDGSSVSMRKIDSAIDHLFTKDTDHHQFLRRDNFTSWLHQIGRKNASYIRAVKFEGFFKTVEAGQALEKCPIGLSQLLPIYTTILNKICPNLRFLTIFQGPNAESWNITTKYDVGMSDEDRMDLSIMKVVRGLPQLRILQLDATPQKMPSKSQKKVLKDTDVIELDPSKPWGVALRWEELVAARTKKEDQKRKQKELQDSKAAEREFKAEQAMVKAKEQYVAQSRTCINAKTNGRARAESIVAIASTQSHEDILVAEVVPSGSDPKERREVKVSFRKGKRGKPGSRAAKNKAGGPPRLSERY